MDSRSPDAARAAPWTRSRRRWLFAITLWTAFLGATLNLLALVVLLPRPWITGLGLDTLSVVFLCSWLLVSVPIALALMLALPLYEGRGPDHGR